MRHVFLAATALAVLGGNAWAAEAPAKQPATKVLQVCDAEAQSWRAFSRDLGLPDYVTAKQVLADTSKGWAEPKCITASELRRLTGEPKLERVSLRKSGE